ncbi:MAG: bifunctional DNA-formamidopyrimidine glycosylase/DNA-(apurinic or apyrimidinic site) lyase [Burkholderiaceae bacterium]|jgi:formamidopyrimidine-DNA glycosylase|nr:bifunctional DNA-formamidopyrimidine glycosylase/DNA-(apurinic or apyrimidinic site) lyase [Burkholderiaceae bacterium]
MPELPEVEVTRRSFVDRIVGARILGVRQGKPLRWPLGIASERLVGRTVLDVGRRGKYLLLQLDDGVLLLHLGMSGSLSFRQAQPAFGVHDHFDLRTTQGMLRLHDPRRFGAVVWSPSIDTGRARRLLAGLGAEPLDEAQFEPAAFHAGLRARRAPIKQVLLAGDLVVGVGNIYASEALFLAGIRPTVRANRLSRQRADRLHAAIRQVLSRAVERGGSTLRNFSNAAGESGHFQSEAAVYGRVGEPCVRCGTPLKLIRQGQRSTYFCPHCQK